MVRIRKDSYGKIMYVWPLVASYEDAYLQVWDDLLDVRGSNEWAADLEALKVNEL